MYNHFVTHRFHSGESAATQPLSMHIIEPIAAIGYSLVYLLFGGGLGGAVIIYIVAKMLGR